MIDVCVVLEDGDFFQTKFNGTYDEAMKYYVGKTFNMGSVKDDIKKCVSIYFLY